jgi:hypothetical protein
MRAMTAFLLTQVAGLALAANTPSREITPADPAQYGPALAYEKVGNTTGCAAMVVGEKVLYSIGRGALTTYDISTPAAPKELGKLSGLGGVRQLAVQNGVAYVTARDGGLWLVDVKDPAAPKLLSRYDTVELATGIDVAGDVAFVAQRVYGVELVDVSDPTRPEHLCVFKTREAQSVKYHDQKMYIGDWYSGEITIVDVSNPRAPKLLSLTQLDGYGDGIDLRDNLCFAATGHHAKSGPADERYGHGHGVEIFDISDASKPSKIAGVKFPQFYNGYRDFWTPRATAKHLFVADTHNGVFVLDISTPASPRFIGHLRLPLAQAAYGYKQTTQLPDAVMGIAVGDGVLYVAGSRTGLYVVRMPGVAVPLPPLSSAPPQITPAPPLAPDANFISYRPDGQARGAWVEGDLAWVACGRAGLHLLKLREDGMDLQRVWPLGEVFGVAAHGDILAVAEGGAGLALYRRAEGSELRLLGRLQPPSPGSLVQRVWIPGDGRFAVYSTAASHLFFVDISDPQAPRQVMRHGQTGLLYSDLLCHRALNGRYVGMNWHNGGLAWYDLGGDKPAVAKQVVERLTGHLDGVVAVPGEERMLYVNKGGYSLLPALADGPSETWTRYFLPDNQRMNGVPSIDGKVMVLSNRAGKYVTTIDISDITAPKLIPERQYQFEGNPDTVVFWRGRMLIPCGYQGLLLERRDGK